MVNIVDIVGLPGSGEQSPDILVGMIRQAISEFSQGQALDFSSTLNQFTPHWNPFHRYKDPRDQAKTLAREYMRSQESVDFEQGTGGSLVYTAIDQLPVSYLQNPELAAAMGIFLGRMSSVLFVATVLADSDDNPLVKARHIINERDRIFESICAYFGKGKPDYNSRLLESLKPINIDQKALAKP